MNFKKSWDQFLKTVSNDDGPSARRKSERRSQDTCVIVVDGTQYPVVDWSMGGAQIEAQGRQFQPGESVDFTIKFRLSDRVLDVSHSAKILRTSKSRIALEFDQLPGEAQTAFRDVVSDATNQQFG